MSASTNEPFSQLQDRRDRAEQRFFRAKLLMSCIAAVFGLLALLNLLAFALVAPERLLVPGYLFSALVALSVWSVGGQHVDGLETQWRKLEAAVDRRLAS